MDTPTVVAYNSKVKLFFSIIIFNTCDEWTLHHNMCSMSFTEVLTWIKEGVDHAWKGWIMKHLDWGPNPSAPYASTRSPRYLWYKETRRLSLIRFGKVDSDSRNSPHQNHHWDHIWTLFWTFFIWIIVPYYVVIRARFISERLQFFSYLPIVEKKPTNIVDLFLVTYKHFEPFAITI
jgi:hypothetical protein